MASSSSSCQQNNGFSGIEPAGERRVVCESSKLYDVFINHRGPDVKQTLAIPLYNSLEKLGIRAFLDSQDKELGNSFPSIIETAIRSASVHISIFSKGYAHSPWCLAELLLILQTQAKIIPVFYEVEPWELRHIEKGVYAEAFIKYKEKGRYLDKLPQWKEALHSLSFIAGEEFNSLKSFSDCKSIVEAVQKEVQRKQSLHVATYPVGLEFLVKDFERRCLDELVQDFENQCILQGRRRDKGKAKVVGIFGMGGVGKTTLAKELFNRKRSDYSRASFLFDVREASVRSDLPSLQLKLVKDLFDVNHGRFTSIEEGTSFLKHSLQRSHLSNFLIVVDDIDHVDQLDALLVMDILNTLVNSLVIITTRDVGVLIAAGVTAGYHLKGMDRNYGRQLFCWHAFGQPHPCSKYEELVEEFVHVCGGLPLSLQVLGRHVHGRAPNYWNLELSKVRETMPRDVKTRLKISFDALDWEEKQIFMDIACFFVGREKSIAHRVWEGSRWKTQHALKTLTDKCLLNSDLQEEFKFRMHDHLRDLGREMALELGPPHRLWHPRDLDSIGFKEILAKPNVRCFHSIEDVSMGCQVTFFLGQSDNSVETSSSLLWLKVQGNRKKQPSLLSCIPLQHLQFFQLRIPAWVPLQNLQCLHISDYTQLKTLWKNHRQAPSNLKELTIFWTSLKEFSYLCGNSDKWGKSSRIKTPMRGLEELLICQENFLPKILINGFHYASLKIVDLISLRNLREVELTRLRTLEHLGIKYCYKLERLEGKDDLTKIAHLHIDCCPNLTSVSGNFDLKWLKIVNCPKLVELPTLSRLNYLKLSVIRSCPKVEKMEGFEELQELERMELSCVSSAAIRIRIWIAKLKSALFVFALSGAGDATSSISLHKMGVQRSSPGSVEYANEVLSSCLSYESRLPLCEEEYIITVGHERSKEIASALLSVGMLQKWYNVFVKEGEECKIKHLVSAIFDLVKCVMKSELSEMFYAILE